MAAGGVVLLALSGLALIRPPPPRLAAIRVSPRCGALRACARPSDDKYLRSPGLGAELLPPTTPTNPAYGQHKKLSADDEQVNKAFTEACTLAIEWIIMAPDNMNFLQRAQTTWGKDGPLDSVYKLQGCWRRLLRQR